MSLPQEIADAVNDLGEATYLDVALLFPLHDLDQVRMGLKNAKRRKMVAILRRLPGARRKPGLAVYGPIHAAPPPVKRKEVLCVAVPSVFDLAGGGVHIPVCAGQRFSPLGGWSD